MAAEREGAPSVGDRGGLEPEGAENGEGNDSEGERGKNKGRGGFVGEGSKPRPTMKSTFIVGCQETVVP